MKKTQLALATFLLSFASTALLTSCLTSRPPDYHPLPVTSKVVREGTLALRDSTEYRYQDLIAQLARVGKKPTLPPPPAQGAILVNSLVTRELAQWDWEDTNLYVTGQILVGSEVRPFRWSYRYSPRRGSKAIIRSSLALTNVSPSGPVSFEPVNLLALRPKQTLPFEVLRGTLDGIPFQVLATESPGVPDTIGHRLINGFLFYPFIWLFSTPFEPGKVTSGITVIEEEQRFQIVNEAGEVWAEAQSASWGNGKLNSPGGMSWGSFRVFGAAPRDKDAELESIFSAIVVLSYAARDFDGVNTDHIPGD